MDAHGTLGLFGGNIKYKRNSQVHCEGNKKEARRLSKTSRRWKKSRTLGTYMARKSNSSTMPWYTFYKNASSQKAKTNNIVTEHPCVKPFWGDLKVLGTGRSPFDTVGYWKELNRETTSKPLGVNRLVRCVGPNPYRQGNRSTTQGPWLESSLRQALLEPKHPAIHRGSHLSL